jgi:hypothetical protein
MDDGAARTAAERFVAFLEDGVPPAGLFTDEVFCDFTMPLWRLQAQGVEGVVALRRQGHPSPGKVTRWRCDATPTGFVIEVEESWDDGAQRLTCREMVRADLDGVAITELSVYCTGDWDDAARERHGREVALLRR